MKIFKRRVALKGALEGSSPKILWLDHLKRLWPLYAVGIFSVILTDFCEVAVPKVLQWCIDTLSAAGLRPSARHHFFVLLEILATVLAVQFVGRIGWRLTLAQQSHRTAAKMKSLVWNRARFFPRARLETDLSPGELMNVATGDVGTARMIFGFTLVGMVDFFFVLVLTTAAMLSIDPGLTIVSLVTLPILPKLLDRLARRESRQHVEAQQSLSALTDLAAQTVATIRLQRITQSGAFWQRKLEASADDYRQKRLDVVHTSLAFIPYTGLAPLISYALILLLGLKKLYAGHLSVGGFLALQSYVFTIQGPLIDLGTLISEWQRCFASLRRITQVLQEKEAPGLRQGGVAVVPREKVFEVADLTFRYPGHAELALRPQSFSLRQGERLGIFGPIGAGKSTLLMILAGLERGFEGRCQLYEKDVRSYSHAELRRSLALVPQKPFLFADTVRNNLRLAAPQATDDDIWRVLQVAALEEDVKRFPEGLETKLGEWGINLSGGQKQRLTLARALLARPRILLLDDCLSAVDTVTEEKILTGLDRELKGLTAVWVAHRASTLKHCDQRLELFPVKNLGAPEQSL